MVWALMIFFIFITVVFLVIALAFPEWVGITGKKALEIQKHQTGEDSKGAEDSATSASGASSPSTGNKPL